MIKNILLAEDDRVTAKLVKIQLEQRGYHIYTAENGIQALKILGSSPVDLIITDVVMPEMDGVDLYARVKKNPATAKIPVIIVTDKEIFKESFSSLGVSHFVEKSTDITTLIEKIKAVAQAANEVKEYHKVLISGIHRTVLEDMSRSLQERGCLVTMVNSSADILSSVFSMVPHIIILDLVLRDNAFPHEIVRALRAFNFLKRTRIYTYLYLPPDQLEGGGVNLQLVEHDLQSCRDAGMDDYLGQFSRQAFVQKLNELGIK